MDNYIKLLKEDDYTTSNWSGGKTTQMFIYPIDSNYKNLDFKIRISSATVELEESIFTKLNRVHRFITPLDNNLKLTHDMEKYIYLNPFEVYEFSGELNTTSYGKARDFNLMLSNGAKGQLISVEVENSVNLNLEKDIFNIFYSYEGVFTFKLNNEELVLNPEQLLILKFDKRIEVEINSDKTDFLLLSKIAIE